MGLWSGCLTVGAKDWKLISAGTAILDSLSTRVPARVVVQKQCCPRVRRASDEQDGFV